MSIKNNLNRIYKFRPFGLLVIGFVIGLSAMYGFIHPNLVFFQNAYIHQENAYNEVTSYTCSQKDVKAFLKEYIATSSAYRWYLTGTANLACRNGLKAFYTYEEGLPTPTPVVEYKTQTQYVPQYIQQPAQPQSTSSQCRPDYAGGMYCTSDTGVETHCTSNYAGGMNCN